MMLRTFLMWGLVTGTVAGIVLYPRDGESNRRTGRAFQAHPRRRWGLKPPPAAAGGLVQNCVCQRLRLLGAIVDRDAVIRVAAQEKAGVCGEPLFDRGDSLRMAEHVLRDGPLPADDVDEDRLG